VIIEKTMEEMVNVQHNVKYKKKLYAEIEHKKNEKNVIIDLKITVTIINVLKNVQHIKQIIQIVEMVK
jgi:deoxyadenosine/deoxycytidine kinase